jgi:dystonin
MLLDPSPYPLPSPCMQTLNKALAKEVKGRAPAVDKTKRKGEALEELCVPEEQEVVQSRLDSLDSRYETLAAKTAAREAKLARALANNQVFGQSEATLLRWLTETERQLAKLDPISIYPDRVRRQLATHRQLNDGIQARRPDINKVLRDGQELLKQCTGKEIIDVQQKLDNIQNRYEDVCQKSEDHLSQLQQAVPLTQDFSRLQRELDTWLGQAERDLRSFDASAPAEKQKAVQEKLQREIDAHRPQLDDLNDKGDKLIVISPGQGAAEIRQQCTDANTRFNELSGQTKEIEYRLSAMLEGAQKVGICFFSPAQNKIYHNAGFEMNVCHEDQCHCCPSYWPTCSAKYPNPRPIIP